MAFNLDAEIQKKVKPSVDITFGGDTFHLKKNANLIKSFQGFIKFYTGKLIDEGNGQINSMTEDERHYAVMAEMSELNREDMRIDFLDVMFLEPINAEVLQDKLDWYNHRAGTTLFENIDELVIWVIQLVMPVFQETLFDTQKSKPARKPQPKKKVATK